MPAALGLVAVALALGVRAVSDHYEHQFLSTGPNGPQTPMTFGAPFERVGFASGRRRLDGYLVRAPAACPSQVAVLIFHGVGETISYWPKTQRLLYDRCIGSLVFDYSGHGESSPPGSIANLDADATAAWAYFAARFASVRRRCAIGHSMGNGPLLASISSFVPRPACVVVANAFSSLRALGVADGAPAFVMSVVPDYWDNVVNVGAVRSPLLVVHSDADRVIPQAMGKQVFAAAPEPKALLIVHGFRHNAIYRQPETWWPPVIAFLRADPAASD